MIVGIQPILHSKNVNFRDNSSGLSPCKDTGLGLGFTYGIHVVVFCTGLRNIDTWALSYKELQLIQINRNSSNQSQVCSFLSLMCIVVIDINSL